MRRVMLLPLLFFVGIMSYPAWALEPMVDYKIWYIKRDNGGVITEAAVRWYEGDVTTLNEPDPQNPTGPEIPVTRYRRTRRLVESELLHLGTGFVTEVGGAKAKLYLPRDFGRISTDDQLRDFLDSKIKLDPLRVPIDEQKEGTPRVRR
jgi:hypothetical protein